MKSLRVLFAMFLVPFLGATTVCFAQSESDVEPAVDTVIKPESPYSQQFTHGYTFGFIFSNFGFAALTQGELPLDGRTSITFTTQIMGLRDVGEQTFLNNFGQQYIPNKYKRIAAMPIMVGAKVRFFPKVLSDDFRLHVAMRTGVSFAYAYPAFNDANKNGIFDGTSPLSPLYDPREYVHDPLSGLSDGAWHTGFVLESGVDIDFGDDFRSVTSVFFGATLHYFPGGIQILEPYKYDFVTVDDTILAVPVANFGKQSFFVSPVIRFAFGKNVKKKKR